MDHFTKYVDWKSSYTKNNASPPSRAISHLFNNLVQYKAPKVDICCGVPDEEAETSQSPLRSSPEANDDLCKKSANANSLPLWQPWQMIDPIISPPHSCIDACQTTQCSTRPHNNNDLTPSEGTFSLPTFHINMTSSVHSVISNENSTVQPYHRFFWPFGTHWSDHMLWLAYIQLKYHKTVMRLKFYYYIHFHYNKIMLDDV